DLVGEFRIRNPFLGFIRTACDKVRAGRRTINLHFPLRSATNRANLLRFCRAIPLSGSLRTQRTTRHNRRSIALRKAANRAIIARLSVDYPRGMGVYRLAEVRIQDGESIENALRRFKRKVQQEDIIKEVKKHSFYLKPGEKKRIKQALARKRSRKKVRREPVE